MATNQGVQFTMENNENKNDKNDSEDSENDCDEIENPMISREIDDTSRIPNKRKQYQQNTNEDLDEDGGDEILDDTTETDGKIVVEVDLAENAEVGNKPSNTYASKKNVAQGMMDIALLTANANQMRYAMELRNTIVVGLIAFSLVMQITVGFAMIFKGRMYLRGKSKDLIVSRIDTFIVSGIFLITIINIFIASFTTTTGDTLKTSLN